MFMQPPMDIVTENSNNVMKIMKENLKNIQGEIHNVT